jgi:hypothetical protein
MKLTKEEMDSRLLYVQEVYVYYPAKWNTANQLQKELIDVIERYFDGVKNTTGGIRLQYGVRPVTDNSGKFVEVNNIEETEKPKRVMTNEEYTIWKHNVQYQLPQDEHPDELLIEIPNRWCDRCGGYRLFSLDGTMCLSCGKIRKDPFMPKPAKESN